jgi:hypothetical protein
MASAMSVTWNSSKQRSHVSSAISSATWRIGSPFVMVPSYN